MLDCFDHALDLADLLIAELNLDCLGRGMLRQSGCGHLGFEILVADDALIAHLSQHVYIDCRSSHNPLLCNSQRPSRCVKVVSRKHLLDAIRDAWLWQTILWLYLL